MTYKYPYIADKRMYAAVMSACKYIRETGCFNMAVRYNAEKFGVDAVELEKEIRKRQSAGQTGKRSRSFGKKYRYFIVVEQVHTDASGYVYNDPIILKGLSRESVEKRFSDLDWKRTIRADYGGSYAPVYDHIAIADFDTEEGAKAALPKWKDYLPEFC